MKVQVRNATDFEIHPDRFDDVLGELDDREPSDSSELSVALIGDDEMEELHETYYEEPGTTDVLTFNYDDETLEIVLNPYEQRRQAPEVGHDLNRELLTNLVHGYLHGQGYDHTRDDGEHLARQETLLEEVIDSSDPILIETSDEDS